MEPITTTLFVTYAAIGMFTATFAFLLNMYGKRLIGIGVDEVQRRYRNIFINRNITILGEKAAGKTSLIYYLQNGQPLTVSDGKIQSPEPTFGSVVIGSSVKTYSKSRKERLAKIVADVSGDKAFRHLWKEILEDTDPHGIIYMLDGRIKIEDMQNALKPVFEDIFSFYEKSPKIGGFGLRKLKAFHIFVSFSEQCATCSGVIGTKESFVMIDFLQEFEKPKYKHLQNIHFDVSTRDIVKSGVRDKIRRPSSLQNPR